MSPGDSGLIEWIVSSIGGNAKEKMFKNARRTVSVPKRNDLDGASCSKHRRSIPSS